MDAAAPPRSIARDAGPPVARPSTPSDLDQALAMGFPDRPMSVDEVDHWLAMLPTDGDETRQAWLGAAVRRSPPARLGTVWAAVAPRDLPAVVRWFAGRSREAGPAVLPASLRVLTDEPSLDAATAIARLHPDVTFSAPQGERLLSASLDAQLTAARLLSVRTVPWPDAAILDLATPWVWPAIARSMAARDDIPTERWSAALHTTANRCRVAPRLWCNAWRAVRDAAPRMAALATDLAAAIGEAEPTSLPPAVATALRCENAVVADRASAVPSATLHCASAGFEWMAASAQAAVWGDSTTLPRLRVQALESLRAAANGQVQVLEAIASAAARVPGSVSLIRTIARERDPGVLAALLESLVLHVQQARALNAPERRALEQAPFAMAEGPSLEARLHAIALAHEFHDPEPGGPTEVRAIVTAEHADAGVAPRAVRAPAPHRAATLVLATTLGRIAIRLDPHAAPRAVEEVVRAARSHRYDGLTIHRVVPGFVAQGLDPRGDGYGGTEEPVQTELSTRHFDRGAVGIPLAGLDTGGIQLFVVLADSPHLDGRYPWVGRVVEGMEIVDGLLPQDRIERVEVVEDMP
jgi:peptidylprolyl isomerase